MSRRTFRVGVTPGKPQSMPPEEALQLQEVERDDRTEASLHADATICQLVLDRSNLSSLDIRAGLYAAIRRAVRGCA